MELLLLEEIEVEVVDNKTGFLSNNDNEVVDFIKKYKKHNRQEFAKRFDIEKTFCNWREY